MSGPVRGRLPDGRRHLQHGPIDLVIEAWGDASEVDAACVHAWTRFRTVLDELVAELPLLRSPVGAAYPLARGAVAKRMIAAVWPHRKVFITPMAAVAGAVADEILAAMLAGTTLRKAYVNDGGDIAVHVAAGQQLDAGIVDDPAIAALRGIVRLERSCGIATSGWRGRSQSLGIADAATIVARSAAEADAAATLVANAVNIDHPAVHRRRAKDVKEDSDLGDLLVTVDVESLPPAAADAALDCGLAAAADLRRKGSIEHAYLALQGRTRMLTGAERAIGTAPCLSTDAKR
jgi:ApbE superfamily uncharacterized protein (UPF0280 family)